MSEFWHADDEPFFRERTARKQPGERRSLERALLLATHWGLPVRGTPTSRPLLLTIVGSKGKGTAAVYASARLAACGLRVGTVTSPGYRSHRERIRVDGNAIDHETYRALSRTLDTALSDVLDQAELPGYLGPTGAYTLMGMFHFLNQSCDAIVLEAGMGGRGDEVSLFRADGTGIVSIFGEHLGVIGNSIAEIADEKAGVIDPTAAIVVSAKQQYPEVRAQITRHAGPVPLVWEPILPVTVPAPPDLIGGNAAVGVRLADEVVTRRLGSEPEAVDVPSPVYATIFLPGRRSIHRTPQTIWGCDSAINGTGAQGALEWYRREIGEPDLILISIPDGKDRTGVMAAVDGYHVVPVRAHSAHLSYTSWAQPLPPLESVIHEGTPVRVLALGTISFIGEVLDILDVATDRVFSVAAVAQASAAGPS